MSEPEKICYVDAPPRQYGKGWRPVETPAHRCTECERLAEDQERRGNARPPSASALDWVSLGRRYWGALCLQHSQREGCWRFQKRIEPQMQSVAAEQSKAQREQGSIDKTKGWLAKLSSEHAERVHSAGRKCVCLDVTRDFMRPNKMPFSVMMGDELSAYEKSLQLHPCSSNCGRLLVKGVGRCFECASGNVVPAKDSGYSMPPSDWHDFEDRKSTEVEAPSLTTEERELVASAERARATYDAEKSERGNG